MRRASTVIPSLNERISFHITKPRDQRPAADRMKHCEQRARSFRALKEIAYHQHRPFIADQLQRTCYGAAVAFASSHGLPLLLALSFPPAGHGR
jgi:hypothetical protein